MRIEFWQSLLLLVDSSFMFPVMGFVQAFNLHFYKSLKRKKKFGSLPGLPKTICHYLYNPLCQPPANLTSKVAEASATLVLF